MQNDPNEDEALLPTVAYQSAWIKANIALELTLLEAARVSGKGREAAKEKAERTVESVLPAFSPVRFLAFATPLLSASLTASWRAIVRPYRKALVTRADLVLAVQSLSGLNPGGSCQVIRKRWNSRRPRDYTRVSPKNWSHFERTPRMRNTKPSCWSLMRRERAAKKRSALLRNSGSNASAKTKASHLQKFKLDSYLKSRLRRHPLFLSLAEK